MKTNPITFAALLVLALGSLAPLAQAGQNTQSSLRASDEKFVKTVGSSGMAEVKLATLGTQKAERADVKDLAQMLVTDHTKVNGELAALALRKGVELSAVIDPDAAETFQSLEKKSGKYFDKAFLSEMEKGHKATIAVFEDAEKNAVDADVKSWAGNTLPTLRSHLIKVQELAAK
jgi:putative membrane protein